MLRVFLENIRHLDFNYLFYFLHYTLCYIIPLLKNFVHKIRINIHILDNTIISSNHYAFVGHPDIIILFILFHSVCSNYTSLQSNKNVVLQKVFYIQIIQSRKQNKYTFHYTISLTKTDDSQFCLNLRTLSENNHL